MASDGTAKTARVVIAVVDGRLWSSGTVDRARTRRLQQDPRSTLFVFAPAHAYRSLETSVTVIDGQEGIDANVRLFRNLRRRPEGAIPFFGTEYDEPDFRELLKNDGRIVYQFEVLRSSGVDEVLSQASTLEARTGRQTSPEGHRGGSGH